MKNSSLAQFNECKGLRAAVLLTAMLIGTTGLAQAQSNDYQPGQSFSFKPTPGSAAPSAPAQPAGQPSSSPTASTDGTANPNDPNDKSLHLGKLGNIITGAVQGFTGVMASPTPAVVVPGIGAIVPPGGHQGMVNPAYPNGYYTPTTGYHPNGSGAGVGLDYNYILSHPPDMSGMPPVRPEFTEQVNAISDLAAQMGTCGYTDWEGWYHPGRPKPRDANTNATAQPPAADGGSAGAPIRDFPTPKDTDSH